MAAEVGGKFSGPLALREQLTLALAADSVVRQLISLRHLYDGGDLAVFLRCWRGSLAGRRQITRRLARFSPASSAMVPPGGSMAVLAFKRRASPNRRQF